jgi:hypothetical protein
MPSLGDAFTRELIDSMPTPHAKMVCISILSRYAGALLYLPTTSKATIRARAARHALNNGMSPADVAAMLRERYSVSSRTALRDVKTAKTNV